MYLYSVFEINMSESQNNYCNNCGKKGHIFHQCKIPITSIGVIIFRLLEGKRQYLMIRRKDTLGYIDFMRGKYSVINKEYIMNMFKQMTVSEKEKLKTTDFDTLWKEIWGDNAISSQYKTEEIASREKFNNLVNGVYINKSNLCTLSTLIDESNQYDIWEEAEWGFPKGRRNYQEKDYECALREMTEETGYSSNFMKNIKNVFPYEEIFTGSNYKSYKHKYFLMYMNYEDSLKMGKYEVSEVSSMEWKTFEECIECMRPYNLEKKRLITNIETSLLKYKVYLC